MFISKPKVIRPLELMLVDEVGFTDPDSLIFDKQGTPYLNVNYPFEDRFNKDKEREIEDTLKVKRVGQGYGEYELDASLIRKIYLAQDNPLYDISAHTFNIGIVPLGYTGSRIEYLKEFFPKEVIRIYLQRKRIQSSIEKKVSRSKKIRFGQDIFKYNIDLNIDFNPKNFPKTAKERKRLVQELEKGDYSRIIQYAEYFEELGEPLTDEQIEVLLRIQDFKEREKSF